MTSAPKKLIVTAEAMAKIVAWIDADKEVHMFLCPDLGCLATYFSTEPALDCQRHAWKCPCGIERQSVTLDDLEIEPPVEPKAPDTPRTWKIITYDVWGNEKDGYEINQSFYSGREVELPAEPEDEQVRAALIEAGYLKKSNQLRHLEFDGDGDGFVRVSRKRDSYPIVELQRED
jgi:hypothetical protein